MIRMNCPYCHHLIEVGDLVITCRCSNCRQIVHVQEDTSLPKSKIARAVEFLGNHTGFAGVLIIGGLLLLMLAMALLGPLYSKWLDSVHF